MIMFSFNNDILNSSRILNRVAVSGPEDLVRKVVDEVQDEKSNLDFGKVIPHNNFMDFNRKDASPYSGYLAQTCIKDRLIAQDFDLQNMLIEEKVMLEMFPDLQADEYIRNKEYFLKNYQNVTKSNFLSFYYSSKLFTQLAGYWELIGALSSCKTPLKRRQYLLSRAYKPEEEAYENDEGSNFTQGGWEASKDVCFQLVDPSSEIFSEYLKGLWGVDSEPRNFHFSLNHDGSALLTFETKGGTPDKVIAALAKKYPGITVFHNWYSLEYPEICRYSAYNVNGKIPA